jgi:hypothetical protein
MAKEKNWLFLYLPEKIEKSLKLLSSEMDPAEIR